MITINGHALTLKKAKAKYPGVSVPALNKAVKLRSEWSLPELLALTQKCDAEGNALRASKGRSNCVGVGVAKFGKARFGGGY